MTFRHPSEQDISICIHKLLTSRVQEAMEKQIEVAKTNLEEALRAELAKINADIESAYIELMELERDRRIESMIRDEMQRIERIEQEYDDLAVLLLLYS